MSATAEAKLERILGPGWETLTARQVEARAIELGRISDFAWALVHSMYERRAPNAGSVLVLAQSNGDETD